MSKTVLPHRQPPGNSVSIPRQRFNFAQLHEGIFVSYVIANERSLCPGARLLWGLIRQRSHGSDGECTSTRAQLAEILGVQERAIRKYDRQLIKGDWMEIVPNPGRVPKRYLIIDDRFSGKVEATVLKKPPVKTPAAAKRVSPAYGKADRRNSPGELKRIGDLLKNI
jgi:hypothetical protein